MLLAIAMVFSMVACGNSETESAFELGGDEEWNVDVDSNSGDNQGATPGNQGATPGNQTGTTSTGATSNGTASNATSSSNKGSSTTSSTTQNGGSNTSVKTPTTKNADSLAWKDLLAQMPSTLRGTTLNVCSWNPIKDVTGAEKVISDFEKQTGIKVVWTQKSYDTYEQDILAMINSGVAPDIMRYNHPTPAKMYLTQDVKSATGYDFKGAIWDKNATSAYTVNGKIYGVNLKNTFNQQPTVVTYSMSTINRYKLEDPYVLWKEGKWTWKKFVEMCKDFKEETGRPAWMTSGHTETIWFNNVDMYKFDGKKYTSNLSDPKVLKAIQQSANNMADGLVCEAMREHDKLENGTYLFFTTNILATRRTDFHFSTLKANDDLYAVPVPTGVSSDGKYYQHYQEFEAYGIPKGARNPGAVYYFLRYYLNADNYDEDMFFVNNQTLETYKYCMAQKNVHYTVDLTEAIDTNVGGISDFIRTGGTAAQVQNKIDELKPVYERAAKQANETVAKF